MFLSSKHPNKAQMKDQDRIKDQLGAIKTGGRGRTPRAVQTELVMFSEMKFFFSLPQFKHSFFFGNLYIQMTLSFKRTCGYSHTLEIQAY